MYDKRSPVETLEWVAEEWKKSPAKGVVIIFFDEAGDVCVSRDTEISLTHAIGLCRYAEANYMQQLLAARSHNHPEEEEDSIRSNKSSAADRPS